MLRNVELCLKLRRMRIPSECGCGVVEGTQGVTLGLYCGTPSECGCGVVENTQGVTLG